MQHILSDIQFVLDLPERLPVGEKYHVPVTLEPRALLPWMPNKSAEPLVTDVYEFIHIQGQRVAIWCRRDVIFINRGGPPDMVIFERDKIKTPTIV